MVLMKIAQNKNNVMLPVSYLCSKKQELVDQRGQLLKVKVLEQPNDLGDDKVQFTVE